MAVVGGGGKVHGAKGLAAVGVAVRVGVGVGVCSEEGRACAEGGCLCAAVRGGVVVATPTSAVGGGAEGAL